jgi:TonB family protein
MSNSCSSLFTSVQGPDVQGRWGSFAAGYMVQATALVALVTYAVTVPTIMPRMSDHVDLVAPSMESSPKAARVKPIITAKIAPLQAALVQPKIDLPVLQVQQPQRIHRAAVVTEVAQPQLSVAAPKFDSKVLNALPGPKVASRIVATNTFGGSSAVPTLQKVVPSKVQTGGFGDPNGVSSSARGSNQPTIAATGSFDLPQGAGYGNGRGGASGVRGTLASAGFGNGVAVQGGGGRGGNANQGRVQSTSFTSSMVSQGSPDRNRSLSQQPLSVPVSIQSKPTPVYTTEARQLRVEGEVLLNVVFTAGGQIRILNIVRGLGHGLDESAQHAAQGVKFSPAMRDGHPVDSNATLHIIFQLS